MSMILSQVAVHRVLINGISYLKDNSDILDDIFGFYTHEFMNDDYGQDYIDGIKEWFVTTKIPVVQAWSLNRELVPSISVHLADEREDEQKASIGDFFGDGENSAIGVGNFTVMLDIGIHADKTGDTILWLYAIVSWILFRYKRDAESMGIYLQTYNASDYRKEDPLMPENVWTRWIRFKCTASNCWSDTPIAVEATEIVNGLRAQQVGETEDTIDLD